MLLRLGTHPNGKAGGQQQFERARLGDDAAASSDDEMQVLAEHLVERLALGAAEGLLAEHVEDFAQVCAAAPLNLAVELDEGHVEALGQQAAEGRFATAAQTDERNTPTPQALWWLAEMLEQHFACIRQRGWRQPLEELRQEHEIQRRLGAVVQQLSHREPNGARNAPQEHDRAVAFAGLELGEIAFGHPCMRGQRLARHAALVAQCAKALAEAAQIGIAAATVGTDTSHHYPANMHYSAKQGANPRPSTENADFRWR